ncbi:hypothetical protein ACCZ74_12325 [Agrobacterium vitis]|uniref:hypothetical protein n=1 Tax=Agrobacterium vitis TaxID=373 RepID=UPI00403EEA11
MKFRKFVIWSVAWLSILQTANAQQIMDGSDKSLAPEIAANAMKAVMRLLVDPYSAQFEALRPWETDPGSICGRVNAKNSFGGYQGFQNFRYIINKDEAFIHANTGCK